MLTSEQVLEILLNTGITKNLDRQVLRRWTREGRIKGILNSKKEGYRYPIEEVKRFISEMKPSIPIELKKGDVEGELERLRQENAELKEAIRFLLQPKPILKWAGGKQQLLNTLLKKAPRSFSKYIEPFFGGGAFFFGLTPKRAVIADINPELINLYQVVASNVTELISILREFDNTEDTFYRVRGLNPLLLSGIERAARMLYLNRTCFNGLYRVNSRGEFNVPFGNYTSPTIIDEKNLRAVSLTLQDTEIVSADYKKVLWEHAQPGDFVFLDPPYIPVNEDDFVSYTKEPFNLENHFELANEVKRLSELGCHVIITNSNHPLVHELFGKHKISVHKTKRNINADAENRVGEDVVVVVEPKRIRAVERQRISVTL